MTKNIIISALCVLMLGLGAATAFAADIYVDWAGGADYTTIQAAVDAAGATDIIHVAAGTYTEQVHITTSDISIDGAGVGSTVIASPVTLTAYFTTGTNSNYPVVFIDGATGVALSNLTVDGANQGDTNPRFIGVGFWNGDGSMTDMEVLNVMDSTFSGAQHGVGVYSYNDTGGPYNISMTDVLVDDYQKTGVALLGDGLTVDLLRVTTVGQGATAVTAQNGIQLGYGSGGTVEDCTITGNDYTGGTWTASGFLPSDGAPVTVDGLVLDYNQTSLYIIDIDGSYNDVTVTNPSGDAFYAMTDPLVKGAGNVPEASPFDEELAGGGGRATMTVSFSNSSFTGAGATDSWGPSSYAMGNEVDMTVTDCTVTGWDWGIVAYEDGGPVTTTISGCGIYGNTSYGFFTNATAKATQDVSGNWWGDPSGPGGDGPGSGNAVTGAVDYSPWLAAVPGTVPMPYGTDDSIQDAIDLASPGATVTVSAGTYDEMLNVNKALTLRGANWGIHPAVGTHPTEVVGTRVAETILSHNGLYALRPSADDITVDGFMFTGDGARIIDTYDDADNFHLTNCIFDNDGAYAPQGVIQFGGGSHTGMLVDFNLFETGEVALLYTGGGPWDDLTIEYNLLNCEGDAVFWTGTPLVDGVISGNEFDGTIDGTPGIGFCTVNIGQAGNILIEDNYVHDVYYTAFQVGIIGGAVRDNVFERIYPYPTYNGDCFQLWGGEWGTAVSDDVEITGNAFRINDAPGITEPTHGLRLRGPEAPDPGIDGTTIVCRDNLFLDGGVSTGALAIRHQGDTTKDVDAEMNWWGDGSGPYHGTLNPTGLGIESGDYVDFDPWILANIYCDPDPLDLVVGSTTGTIDVDYLGGGGGLVYGYSVTVTWDNTKATLTGITEGNLLSDAGATNFFAYGPDGAKTIDCALTGGSAGVTGPGTLFTLAFSAAGLGTSTVVLDPALFRDNANAPLSGFSVDHGVIRVDILAPTITDVEILNTTLGHTDDYIKNADAAQVTATVLDDDPAFGTANIVADLTDLGGGAAVNPVSHNWGTGEAIWNLASVTCAPADGTVWVYVDATDALGNAATQGSDDITSDNTLPGNVTGFAAAPAHGEGILSWTNPTSPSLDTNYYGIVVRYDAWGDYPYYDLPDPAPYPATPTAGAGEAFDGLGVVTGAVHVIVPRDIHYYSAFAYDWALNYGGVDSGGQDRCTNYWLGDVAATLGTWGYNGLVNVADIGKLGGNYGSAPPVGVPGYAECDVGPTDDNSRVGIPEPDDMLNFEDLMIFAMNYGVVAAKVVPFLGEPSVGDLALALVENGRTDGGVLELALRLEGNLGDVKGLTAELEFEGLEFLSARLSDDMSSPMADMFFWSDAASRSVQVDAAVLGTDVTIGGSGDVVVFSFQVLDETYAVDFTSAELRGASNEDLTAELEGLSSEGVPVAFKLVQNSPNPFNPVTKVAYHVPHESRVTIRVFDVTGRLVTTLADGVVEPGRHSAVWNGTNDRGESVGSGVYFCTMETPDYRDSHKMTLLK